MYVLEKHTKIFFWNHKTLKESHRNVYKIIYIDLKIFKFNLI